MIDHLHIGQLRFEAFGDPFTCGIAVKIEMELPHT